MSGTLSSEPLLVGRPPEPNQPPGSPWRGLGSGVELVPQCPQLSRQAD